MRIILLLIFSIATLLADSSSSGTYRGMKRDPEMEAFVRDTFAMIGLHNVLPVVIHPNHSGCAYASTDLSTGEQFLGFDPVCVGPLRSGTAYSPRASGIMLHEVGHILSAHTLNNAHNHREELEADEWSGWMMRKRNATIDEALTAFRSFDEKASLTHPGRADRLIAVTRGWMKANDDAPLPPVHPPPRQGPNLPVKRTWWEELMKWRVPWTRLDASADGG